MFSETTSSPAPSSSRSSTTIRSLALTAMLVAVACTDPGPTAPGRPASDAFPADPALIAASAQWSAIARDLVATHRNNPFQAIRNLALLNLAQYNSVIAAEQASRGARRLSRRAAAAAASAVVLMSMYPSDSAALADRLLLQVAAPGWLERGARELDASLAVGRAVGASVVGHARTDRFYDPWTGTVPTGVGIWYSSASPPAPPGGAVLGHARTFLLDSGRQFRPAPPPAPGSPEFIAALAEVRRYSDTRTPEQDSIARFWAFPTGTFTPAGYWSSVAAALADANRFGERRTAHLLALASMAVYDALVACNDAKYAYWLVRPSQADPEVTPSIGLPNFPSYPSNHACLSAAAAEVIGARIPGERQRLAALADEAALSRVYGGIHFRFDGDVGLTLGRRVARHALSSHVSDHTPLPLR